MRKKTPKSEVGYQEGSGKQRCAYCAHFLPPDACEGVAGKISGGAWCVRWQPKASAVVR